LNVWILDGLELQLVRVKHIEHIDFDWSWMIDLNDRQHKYA